MLTLTLPPFTLLSRHECPADRAFLLPPLDLLATLRPGAVVRVVVQFDSLMVDPNTLDPDTTVLGNRDGVFTGDGPVSVNCESVWAIIKQVTMGSGIREEDPGYFNLTCLVDNDLVAVERHGLRRGDPIHVGALEVVDVMMQDLRPFSVWAAEQASAREDQPLGGPDADFYGVPPTATRH